MNGRTFVTILVIQFILMGMFLTYGLVQRTQAIKNEELARQAQVEALNQAEIALKTAEAYKQELEKCMTHQ